MAEPQATQNRRHQLVVMRRFQFNYVLTGLVTILVVVNFGIIAAMLWLGDASRIGISGFDGALIGIAELLMVGVVGFLGLRKSHTIAGPVVVMEKNLARFRDGDLTARMRLRSSDRFQESAEAFNEMAASIHQRIAALKVAVSRLEAHADSCPQMAPALEEINGQLRFFETFDEDREVSAKTGGRDDEGDD